MFMITREGYLIGQDEYKLVNNNRTRRPLTWTKVKIDQPIAKGESSLTGQLRTQHA